MKKIFKSRKTKRINFKRIVFLLLISFFSSYFLSKLDYFKNEDFLNLLKNTSVNKIYNRDIRLNGKYLINIALTNFEDIKFTKEVFKQEEKGENKPRIYIYNTHQTEEYAPIKNYNLTPTVYTAAYILKDFLNDYGIGSIVEDSDFKSELNNNGYTYNEAYKVSRSWLEKLNNHNMDLYIDLHRDGINYNLSNVTIDGKDYAKIMFVLATNYDYKDNEQVVNKLLNELESINKNISRGIFISNYIYNQDFNNNCILIELGGPESTYESIVNSLDVLALAIKNYLGE